MDSAWVCRWVLFAAALALAGTAWLQVLARGTDLGGWPQWRRLAWAGWGWLLCAGLFQLWLTAAVMSDQTLWEALSGPAIRQTLGTQFGHVWLSRMALLSIIALWPRPAIIRLVLAEAVVASLVWNGHSHASLQSAWLLPVNLGHVLAAGAWPGGLLPLAVLLVRVRSDPTLLGSALIITRRFSRVSVAAVAVLALTGFLNACGLLGHLTALWTTAYGRWLLCKIALFALMVALGAANRRQVLGPSAGAETIRSLRRRVAWECLLAAGVLAATEALATGIPPASAN